MTDTTGTEMSTIVRTARRVKQTIHQWVQASQVVRTLNSFEAKLGTAPDHSTVVGALETLGRWTRASWGYRWLTKEPEPEVIVIDLRETWTVGPVIAGIDYIAKWTGRRWRGSSAQNVWTNVAQSVESAPIRITGLVASVALVVNVLVSAIVGELGDATLGVRFILLGVALLATRVDMSWDELRSSRVGKLVVAILAPPEPSEKSE